MQISGYCDPKWLNGPHIFHKMVGAICKNKWIAIRNCIIIKGPAHRGIFEQSVSQRNHWWLAPGNDMTRPLSSSGNMSFIQRTVWSGEERRTDAIKKALSGHGSNLSPALTDETDKKLLVQHSDGVLSVHWERWRAQSFISLGGPNLLIPEWSKSEEKNKCQVLMFVCGTQENGADEPTCSAGIEGRPGEADMGTRGRGQVGVG